MGFIYAALAAAIMSAFGTWKVQEWRHDAIDKDRIEAAVEKAKFDRRAVDIAAVGHEKDKVQIRTVTQVIIQEIDRVSTTPFYAPDAPACLDADGLRIATEAATGRASAASEPAPAVQGLKPSNWWQPGRSAAVDRPDLR